MFRYRRVAVPIATLVAQIMLFFYLFTLVGSSHGIKPFVYTFVMYLDFIFMFIESYIIWINLLCIQNPTRCPEAQGTVNH